MLRKKHYWCASWRQNKGTDIFKISQCEFLSVETAPDLHFCLGLGLSLVCENPGYMYLKYSVFNTPTFRIKMMKKLVCIMIQWLTHTSLVSLMDESVFLNESRMNDSIIHFLNSHLSPLVAKLMQSTQTLFEAPVAFKRWKSSILIATIEINVCSRTINFYPKSFYEMAVRQKIILCSWKTVVKLFLT